MSFLGDGGYQVPSGGGISGTRSLLGVGMSSGVGMFRGGYVTGYRYVQGVCLGDGYIQGGGYLVPRPRHGTWDTVDKRAVRILLECFLVNNRISASLSYR